MLRLPSIDKGSKCREGVRYGASAENFAEKAARAAQPGGGFALGAGSDCLLGRARVLPERVQRGVSGAAGAACADRAAGEAAGAVRAAPAARPDGGDCGAVPARRLHRPARDGGAAAQERVIEAGIQEETKTPAADEPAQEQPSEPDIPDTESKPETPADIDPESETPTSAEPEVPSPAAPDPAPAEPSPSPVQSETVYITQTGKKYHRAGCRHLQKSQIPISLDDAKAKGYTACKSCGG